MRGFWHSKGLLFDPNRTYICRWGHAILHFVAVFRLARGFFRDAPRLFSLWVPLYPKTTIPAGTVSECGDGLGSEGGCERFLLANVAERLYFFGARPQGMPEWFSLSSPECGRTVPEDAVQFWSISDNS